MATERKGQHALGGVDKALWSDVIAIAVQELQRPGGGRTRAGCGSAGGAANTLDPAAEGRDFEIQDAVVGRTRLWSDGAPCCRHVRARHARHSSIGAREGGRGDQSELGPTRDGQTAIAV